MTTDAARRRAEDSVATHFTRPMNAATSPYGVATDLSMASAFAAIPIVLLVREAVDGGLGSPASIALGLLVAVPVAGSLVIAAQLRGARGRVIDWLAAQPFPIDNVNSLLVGISDSFEVAFEPEDAGTPMLAREALQKLVDRVSDDTLATGTFETERRAEIKIGVVESRRLPLRSAYLRYERFRRLVEEVLVPLHRSRPIRQLRVI